MRSDGRRTGIRIGLAGLALSLAASPAWSETLACYPGARGGGTVERICESPAIVTVDRVPADGEPVRANDAIRDLHAEKNGVSLSSLWGPGPGQPHPGLSRWTGMSISAGALGREWTHAGPGLPVARLGLGFDAAAAPGWPLLLGLEVSEDFRATRGAGDLAPARGITDANGRIGVVVTNDLLVFATGGESVVTGGPGIGRRRTGWNAGAGLRYALDARWSLTLDYRYRAIGAGGPPGPASGKPRQGGSSVVGGITYRFVGL